MLDAMVFGLSTDDHTLQVFQDADAAVSYAEGVDVEDGGWLFFADDGSQLEAVFTEPNKRGWFWVQSGRYILRPSTAKGNLLNHLDQVARVAGPPVLASVEAVRTHLTRR